MPMKDSDENSSHGSAHNDFSMPILEVREDEEIGSEQQLFDVDDPSVSIHEHGEESYARGDTKIE